MRRADDRPRGADRPVPAPMRWPSILRTRRDDTADASQSWSQRGEDRGVHQARTGPGRRLRDRRQRYRDRRDGPEVRCQRFRPVGGRGGSATQRKTGQGEVVVVSLGRRRSAGADPQGVEHGRGSRGPSEDCHRRTPDALVVAQALADELQAGGYDLLLFGRVAVDAANGATGAMVATFWDLPCVTAFRSSRSRRARARAARARGRTGSRWSSRCRRC